MYPESVIGIIFGTSLAAFVALGIFVLIGLKIMKGGKAKSRQPQEQESRTIQEIYRGLTRMEQRIETLEAILFDREKDGERHEL
ncbi:MAG TPA: hypothetical protein VM425_05850 [Myxococcota bacterium]|nr:hypothetical protein [Myxococcota bacterium]